MSPAKVTEGTVPFNYHNLPKACETWYEIHGDIKNSSLRPLVVVHGGPGSNHDYLLSLTDLADNYGIPIIFYDQLGAGNSTRLREKRLDASFWTVDLFIAELDNLLDHLEVANDFDLLGQSWGGMLGASFAIRGHPGLNRLVISNSPASLTAWVAACNRYREELPREVNEVLERCEASKDFDNQDYKNATNVWYERHLCRSLPWPDYLVRSNEIMEADDTVYFTMNGPSEFTVIGSLCGFDLTGKLNAIKQPTLVINGEFDAADSVAVKPFLEEIAHVRGHEFKGCSHCPHIEKRAEYMHLVADFLKAGPTQ